MTVKDRHACCNCLRKDFCIAQRTPLLIQKQRLLMIFMDGDDWGEWTPLDKPMFGCLKCWIANGENDEADPGVGTIVWTAQASLRIFLCERHCGELRLRHTQPLVIKGDEAYRINNKCIIHVEELESLGGR